MEKIDDVAKFSGSIHKIELLNESGKTRDDKLHEYYFDFILQGHIEREIYDYCRNNIKIGRTRYKKCGIYDGIYELIG
jgi:hypothetical protein